MKKNLLFLSKDSIDFDFRPVDYKEIFENSKNSCNVGNKFFLSATISYLLPLLDMENTIFYSDIQNEYFISQLDYDEINSTYNAIVLPQANIFSESVEARKQLHGLASVIKNFRIPVIVSGVGAQASSYKDINILCRAIKNETDEFCQAVYSTGGTISVRGLFTKQLLGLLGYSDVVVTGCPSIYQVGRDFKIDNRKVEYDSFKPILNGYSDLLNFENYKNAINKYNAEYFDQDEFIELLYGLKLFEANDLNSTIKYLIRKYGLEAVEFAAKNRVKLIYDIPVWFDYLSKNGFNYSFGKRIHGNLISIVNGIPATVVGYDSRTREMAEYYNIPLVDRIDPAKDIYEYYCECDYTLFNKEFEKKFDNYESFLKKYGLIECGLESYDVFEDKNYSSPVTKNIDFLEEKMYLFESNRYRAYDYFFKYKKRMGAKKHDLAMIIKRIKK